MGEQANVAEKNDKIAHFDWVVNLSLAIGATLLILLFLVACEFIVRRMDADHKMLLSDEDITFSDVYGWQLPKRFNHCGAEVTLNTKGYVGKAYDHERSAGTTRILMLGDSILFGFCVRQEDTFAALLDASGDMLEVINFGVKGYGTDQALIRFEREGLNFKPDIVVLNFCLDNDIKDNAAARSIYGQAYPKPYFTIGNDRLELHDDHLKLSLPRRLALFLAQRSVMFHKAVGLFNIDEKKAVGEPASAGVETASDLTIRLIERMARIADENGIKFIVLFYPHQGCFTGNCPLADRLLTSPILSSVSKVNMYDHYVRRGLTLENYDDLAMDYMFHLTPRGHGLTAGIIKNVLVDRGFVDSNVF